MANSYPQKNTLADKYLHGGQVLDISSASVAYTPIPSQGIIVDAFCSISAAITSADSVITVKISHAGATAVTIGTITVPNSGSAAGDTVAMVITGSETARSCARGDTLIFDSGGASSTTSIGTFMAVLREL
jgi:hypothetical protein